MLQRTFDRIVSPPPAEPGFIGEGHTAVEVVTPAALQASDPFVLLMDDRLDLAAPRAIGGAHPHAGLETVTLILEGSLKDRDEGELRAGDVVWMTAGKGIIHNEHVETGGRSRVLQLWIRLPRAQRAAPPRFEIVRGDGVPERREPGVRARVYSGESAGVVSRTLNHVPVTLVDVTLEPASSFEQPLPASYNGFVYVLSGSVRAGEGPWLTEGQVGWLDRPATSGESALRLMARGEGARIVLYAGAPQHGPLVQRGPFVADDAEVLGEMVRDFQAGRFTPMSSLRPSSAG